MEDIGKLAERINIIKKQMEDNLYFINKEIDNMIFKKTKDFHAIEKVLDILLDYQTLGIGETEFKKLLDYYRTFDEEAANDYQRISDDR